MSLERRRLLRTQRIHASMHTPYCAVYATRHGSDTIHKITYNEKKIQHYIEFLTYCIDFIMV